MASVRVGGLEFFGGAGQDGFYIEGEGLQGLLSGVDVKRNSVSRPQAHGDFDVPGFLESRIVSLAGPCIAVSEAVLAHRGRQLTGLLAGGDSLPVTFDVPGGPLWAMGRLASKTEFDVTLWGSRARYQLSLIFADPRLYGEARVSPESDGPTSASLVNFGNFPAAPTYTVTGSRPGGYAIFGPDARVFVVTRPLVGGEIHTVDMATGHLRVNGAVVFGGVAAADTWAVPGGGSVTAAVESGAVISGSVYSTYV